MSTNSVLPGNSRLFPLRLYCVINFFFWCAFLCIFALFLSHVYHVKKLFFLLEFSRTFLLRIIVLQNSFLFHFSQHSANKPLFCAHFFAFYVFSPLLPFLKKYGKTVTKNYTPQSLFKRFSIFISSAVSLPGLLSGWNAFDNVR